MGNVSFKYRSFHEAELDQALAQSLDLLGLQGAQGRAWLAATGKAEKVHGSLGGRIEGAALGGKQIGQQAPGPLQGGGALPVAVPGGIEKRPAALGPDIGEAVDEAVGTELDRRGAID